MITHEELGILTFATRRAIVKLIQLKEIQLAGNKQLKIYGQLKCGSGKRMKISNRVFFKSATEALNLGYRPCGHCLKAAYQKWKNGSVQ